MRALATSCPGDPGGPQCGSWKACPELPGRPGHLPQGWGAGAGNQTHTWAAPSLLTSPTPGRQLRCPDPGGALAPAASSGRARHATTSCPGTRCPRCSQETGGGSPVSLGVDKRQRKEKAHTLPLPPPGPGDSTRTGVSAGRHLFSVGHRRSSSPCRTGWQNPRGEQEAPARRPVPQGEHAPGS